MPLVGASDRLRSTSLRSDVRVDLDRTCSSQLLDASIADPRAPGDHRDSRWHRGPQSSTLAADDSATLKHQHSDRCRGRRTCVRAAIVWLLRATRVRLVSDCIVKGRVLLDGQARCRLTNACSRPTSQSSNLHAQICRLSGGRLMRGVRRHMVRSAMKSKRASSDGTRRRSIAADRPGVLGQSRLAVRSTLRSTVGYVASRGVHRSSRACHRIGASRIGDPIDMLSLSNVESPRAFAIVSIWSCGNAADAVASCSSRICGHHFEMSEECTSSITQSVSRFAAAVIGQSRGAA